MTILAIDTSMPACSAAILHNAAALPVQKLELMTRGHAEAIFPMVEAVMEEAGCDFADLTKLAVTVGPGSFTGVRAGMAAIRGFALAAKCPVAGVNSLEVMAAGYRRKAAETGAGVEQPFAIIHDARRGGVYMQQFSVDGSAWGEAELVEIDQLTDAIDPSVKLAAGSGASFAAEQCHLAGRELTCSDLELLPEAADLALLARNREAFITPPKLLYLRAADAKPQIGKAVARA